LFPSRNSIASAIAFTIEFPSRNNEHPYGLVSARDARRFEEKEHAVDPRFLGSINKFDYPIAFLANSFH
jgi:hypothetical protein